MNKEVSHIMKNILKEVINVINSKTLKAEEQMTVLQSKISNNTATEEEKAKYAELRCQWLNECSAPVKGKYKLGSRTQLKEHNKNGKVAYTTTLSKDNYHFLKELSAYTGKSGSAIINEFLNDMKEEYDQNE